MEWVAIGIPVAAIIGTLVGAWWSKRATERGLTGALVADQLEALWSDRPRQRAAARDTLQDLLKSGSLTVEQRTAASQHLKHWAAETWELPEAERRRLGAGGEAGGNRG